MIVYVANAHARQRAQKSELRRL
jgi:hypothetical protein